MDDEYNKFIKHAEVNMAAMDRLRIRHPRVHKLLLEHGVSAVRVEWDLRGNSEDFVIQNLLHDLRGNLRPLHRDLTRRARRGRV